MFHFREPGPGVLAALEMLEEIARSDLPPAHVGLHAGSVVFQGGDYFGRAVNIAARIGEYERPGEVLVSQEVVDASDLAEVAFTELGPGRARGHLGAAPAPCSASRCLMVPLPTLARDRAHTLGNDR